MKNPERFLRILLFLVYAGFAVCLFFILGGFGPNMNGGRLILCLIIFFLGLILALGDYSDI